MVTVAKLAQLVSGKIISGNKDTVITSISGLKEAQTGEITFLSNTKYLPFLATTRASAVLVAESSIKELPRTRTDLVLIVVTNPDLAFIKVAEYFKPDTARPKKGVDKKAVIGKKVKLGRNVAIQPFVVIEDGASIGDNTVIYPNVYIGQGSTLGRNCILYPNVVLREKTVIGNNVIIHSGTVIGSDGFGYVVVKGVRHKIPQLGNVVIEDDVEIGANVAIDRARFDKTIIRKGTKIDNLVHIAHNVEIGENSVLVAQVGIAGSAKIGRNVILAGQSGVDGHIRVGDNAVVTAKSGVMKDVPPGVMVSGFPARPHTEQLREQATLRKLSKSR